MIKKIFICLFIFSLVAPLSDFAQVNDSVLLMKSAAFDWNSIKISNTQTGTKRQFFNSTTSTLDNLEVHITTLKPGQMAHLPHQHPEEEMTIVKEGTVEVLVDGKFQTVGPGSVVFQAAYHLHSIKNVGATDATYFAIKWKSCKTGTQAEKK